MIWNLSVWQRTCKRFYQAADIYQKAVLLPRKHVLAGRSLYTVLKQTGSEHGESFQCYI